MDYLAETMMRDGRIGQLIRLRAAQEDSREAARNAVIDIGRIVAGRGRRYDRDECRAAMVLAAAHYRNAGDASMAQHWDARAKRLAAGG
jgi:hypothetical protein